jgi:hypothetical protein
MRSGRKEVSPIEDVSAVRVSMVVNGWKSPSFEGGKGVMA